MLLLLALSACSTKTIVKTKISPIPAKYVNGCNYDEFKPSQEAIDGSMSALAIDEATYIITLQAEINRCDRNDQAIIELQEELNK